MAIASVAAGSQDESKSERREVPIDEQGNERGCRAKRESKASPPRLEKWRSAPETARKYRCDRRLASAGEILTTHCRGGRT